ncbi:MAG TPA: hypothetical protein VMP01_26760 [Pirellulaceae bacterium]|nr:hypothetical protein [Pirellulaceae bacterium]
MGLLFRGDERVDLVLMVEEVTECVEHLGLSQSQGLGDIRKGLTVLMQRRHMPHRDAQSIDHGLAAAKALEPDDMRVLSLNFARHARCLAKKKQEPP